MIEVEIRAFINQREYNSLLEFFNRNAKFMNEDFQVTVYFAGKSDLRVQRTNTFSKLWLKGGKIHDMCREEVEVRFARKDFEKLIKLLKVLGFKVRIVWLRRRLVFDWNGTRVYLDDTEGYGRIIELEHYTKSTKEKPEKTLIERLNKLGVKLSQRKEFEERFSWYERHWKELIGGKLKELGLGFLLS